MISHCALRSWWQLVITRLKDLSAIYRSIRLLQDALQNRITHSRLLKTVGVRILVNIVLLLRFTLQSHILLRKTLRNLLILSPPGILIAYLVRQRVNSFGPAVFQVCSHL